MAFNFNKLTIKAQESVAGAQSLAQEAGNPELTTLHLLAALLDEREGIVKPLFDKIGDNRLQLDGFVANELERLPKSSGGSTPQPNAALREVLEASAKISAEMKDEFVSTEHLLLALAESKGDPAGRLLNQVGASHDAILHALQAVRGTQRVTDQNPESKYQALERDALDLTERARQGKLDPVMGRY
jgi:ATP-dependent Clp protease ATP-binding subunit ClpB